MPACVSCAIDILPELSRVTSLRKHISYFMSYVFFVSEHVQQKIFRRHDLFLYTYSLSVVIPKKALPQAMNISTILFDTPY